MTSPKDAGKVVTHPPISQPTLRSIAGTLGLSRTTVSDALRGNARVSFETTQRVRAAARAAGYERNPLTGAVMSLLRKSRSQEFRGVLAVVELIEADRSPARIRYNDELCRGIRERAANFGFKTERFNVPAGERGLGRFESILHARGIQGLLILPSAGFPDYASLQWHRYAAVYLDCFIDRPSLHALCPDHHRSMANLLAELCSRGYRRPGLVMETSLDERLQFRWEGAFLAQQYHLPSITALPPLRVKQLDRESFVSWFDRHQPDVVLGHFSEVKEWIEGCGGNVPGSQGFVCLNHLRAPAGCAALDLRAGLLGARGAEIVIAQLLHSEFGIPTQASLTTLPAELIEGETLRPPRAARAPVLSVDEQHPPV